MHLLKYSIGMGICLITTSVIAGHNQHILNIKNHFNHDLDFKITINPKVLPGLPENFTLNKETGVIQTKVEDFKKEAYISVLDSEKHNAFWGIEIENDKLKIYGYLSKGIAYSWRGETIIFCTPDEYKTKHSCF